MDLVKLYQQIKESCQSIDQKMDLLREDIRKLSNAENSPASKLEDTELDYLDVAQVLHIEQNVMFCHRAPPTGGVIFGARSSSSHVAA